MSAGSNDCQALAYMNKNQNTRGRTEINIDEFDDNYARHENNELQYRQVSDRDQYIKNKNHEEHQAKKLLNHAWRGQPNYDNDYWNPSHQKIQYDQSGQIRQDRSSIESLIHPNNNVNDTTYISRSKIDFFGDQSFQRDASLLDVREKLNTDWIERTNQSRLSMMESQMERYRERDIQLNSEGGRLSRQANSFI